MNTHAANLIFCKIWVKLANTNGGKYAIINNMHKGGGMFPHGGRLSLMEKQNHKEEKMIMSKIVNEAKIKNPFIAKIRELLEHRAFWLYLLVDEAEKKGCAATTASASALMPGWSCPRPLPRVTKSAPCATSSPALSRWRNEKSGHFLNRKTVLAAICGGPVYDHRYIKKP